MTLSRRFAAPRSTTIAAALALAFATGLLAGCHKPGAGGAADAASAPAAGAADLPRGRAHGRPAGRMRRAR